MRLHLDTDFAGDTDDACALAMVLGWQDVELVGITTVADPDGRRAGYVHHVLELVGRDDVPVAAGAGASLTTGRPMGDVPDHDRYWSDPVTARPAAPNAATDLLAESIEQGATIAAIGPQTNLARLEVARPGQLGRVPVVVMGGWLHPPAEGLPRWGPDMDWNIQCDTDAAQTVLASATPTLVTLPVTLDAHLRRAHLERLARSGPLGELLARQAEAHAAEHHMASLARAHQGLPDDLLNFQYDPVACAVAMGWGGAQVEDVRLETVRDGDVVRFREREDGSPAKVVTAIDADGFEDAWLSAVEAAQRRPPSTLRSAPRAHERDPG